MMSSFRWDDLYSNRRERAPHGQSETGVFVSLLNWLLCHIQGRGEENVHWERQGHMKPQNLPEEKKHGMKSWRILSAK